MKLLSTNPHLHIAHISPQQSSLTMALKSKTLILFLPLTGSDDRTGSGGLLPWELDTAGDDSFLNVWPRSRPSPDGGGEEVETPVTFEQGVETQSCGQEMVSQIEQQLYDEDSGSITDVQPITKQHPVVEEGEIVEVDGTVTVEEGEDAAMALASPVSDSSDYSLRLTSMHIRDQNQHEDYIHHDFRQILSVTTDPEDVLGEKFSSLASIPKEPLLTSPLTPRWDLDYQSGETDSCHSESVA